VVEAPACKFHHLRLKSSLSGYQSRDMSQVQDTVISFWIWKLTWEIAVGRQVESPRDLREDPLVLVSPPPHPHFLHKQH
jgi:hypothetical protein